VSKIIYDVTHELTVHLFSLLIIGACRFDAFSNCIRTRFKFVFSEFEDISSLGQAFANGLPNGCANGGWTSYVHACYIFPAIERILRVLTVLNHLVYWSNISIVCTTSFIFAMRQSREIYGTKSHK
jgi:hypothetical protein